MTRQQRKVGMVVRIPVDERYDGFAQILKAPEIAVLNIFRPRHVSPSNLELETAPSLFRVWVMNRALTSGRWRKVGITSMRREFDEPTSRFKRYPITGKLSLYFNGVDHPAQPIECAGLEPAAVWSAEHIEQRLQDYLRGRPHKPLEQLLEGIPRTRAQAIQPNFGGHVHN